MKHSDLRTWTPCPSPGNEVLSGRTCRLEPLDPSRHAAALVEAHAADPSGANWTYLHALPPRDGADVAAWVAAEAGHDDRRTYAVVELAKQRATGTLAFMRIDAPHGSIEIGSVVFSPELQRTTAATEAVHLLAARAFALGYRRLEWKCDADNAASRRAAARFGFTFEGIFRQHQVVKGRNRDTAWFSIVDREWPALDRAFRAWLAPENFDDAGRQRTPLGGERSR